MAQPGAELVLPGDRWVDAYRSVVRGILGDDAPPVTAQGSMFYNQDFWSLRLLVGVMCTWAQKHPGCVPDWDAVHGWVQEVNSHPQPARRILVAAPPPQIPTRFFLAQVGGGVHEAFHTKWSHRQPLGTLEVFNLVVPKWAQVKDWASLVTHLLEWQNLIEDIRIERRGNEVYPGVYVKLCDLQDYILDYEAESRKRATGPARPLNVVACTFRDIGLGYNTLAQQAALKTYMDLDRAAFDFVRSGPLKTLVQKAADLPAADGFSSLRLAMDVLILLTDMLEQERENAAQKPPEQKGNGQDTKEKESGKGEKEPGDPGGKSDKEEGPGEKTPEEGSEKKQGCPSCGAGPESQATHPKADPKGGSREGVQIQTCTVCGHQEQVDTAKEPRSPTPKKLPPEQPKDAPGEEPDDPEEGESQDSAEGSGAGGHQWDPDQPESWLLLLENILADAEGLGLTGLEDILGSGSDAAWEKEEHSCKVGERPWRPYSTQDDIIRTVTFSQMGRGADDTAVRDLLASARKECAFFLSRLRSIVLATTQRGVFHGVPQGRDLSGRMLVDSMASIRAGEKPSRAYYAVGEQIDTSMVAVVLVDQSGSMSDKIINTTKGMLIIVSPLDSLAVPTLVLGFRDGPANVIEGAVQGCHRVHGVCLDVFKAYHESFPSIRGRFAHVSGVGGTPMADGLQVGLEALIGRQETHRVLFVITDGMPNPGHPPVIRRQIRLAKEAGIHVIGVGIGMGCLYIKKQFPDYVWVRSVTELPLALSKKLNMIMDWRGLPRRPVRLDRGR